MMNVRSSIRTSFSIHHLRSSESVFGRFRGAIVSPLRPNDVALSRGRVPGSSTARPSGAAPAGVTARLPISQRQPRVPLTQKAGGSGYGRMQTAAITRDGGVFELSGNAVLERSCQRDSVFAEGHLVAVVESRGLPFDRDFHPGVVSWPRIHGGIPGRSTARPKHRSQRNGRNRTDCPEQIASAKNRHRDIGCGCSNQLDAILGLQTFKQRAIEFDSYRANLGAMATGGVKYQLAT